MKGSMFFILMAAIFIAPHRSKEEAKFGVLLLIGMFFLALLVENT